MHKAWGVIHGTKKKKMRDQLTKDNEWHLLLWSKGLNVH